MNRPDSMTHEQASELLPWLVNDTLDATEQDRVRGHAKSCVVCRRDLEQLEALRDAVVADAAARPAPAPDMRPINSRIDALLDKERRASLGSRLLSRLTRRRWQVAVACQLVLIVILSALLLQPAERSSSYQTLSTPASLPDGEYVRAVFDTRMTATEFDALLEQAGLTLADGPSARGVTTLAFPDSMPDTERQEAVRRLSSSDGVRFAQQIRVGPER